jgi:hypothetical protein
MTDPNPPPTPWHEQPQQPQQPQQQPPPPGYQQQQQFAPQWGQQPTQYLPHLQPPKPPRKRHTVRNVLLSIAGLFVVLGGIGAALGGGSKPAANSGTGGQPSAVSQTTSTPPPAPATTTPPSAPAATTAPPAPQYTVAEQQAIESAQSYLDMGTGFSKAGLIQQLDSSSGEGFSHKLAVFAVSHVHVNWYRQAVLSAKGYMQMGGFSYSSLVDQLSSAYGEQFTVAQAEYAAKKVGL